MIPIQKSLLGFGIGAVAISIFGFVVLGVFAMDSSQPFGMFSFSRDSVTNSIGRMGGMGPGMMGGFWGDSGDGELTQPAYPDAAAVNVKLDDFRFEPSNITVQEGKVNITVVNEGAAVHDLSVPDLGIRIVALPGETVTTGLNFAAPGTYDTLCSIPGHASLGMTGTLIVLPPA